jgi:ArsR family transcriptional regulator
MHMGATKTKNYSRDILDIAGIAKALGHPARLSIIEFLAKSNRCITNDLVNEMPLAQPTISQHVKELRNAGLIQGEVEGNAVCYCINHEIVEKMHLYFTKLYEISKKSSCC